MIVDALQVPRVVDQSPVFQILINYNKLAVNDIELPDCVLVGRSHQDSLQSKFDITIYIQDTADGGLLIDWVYDATLFAHQSIMGFATEFNYLLECLIDEPNTPVLDHGWQGVEVEKRYEQIDNSPTNCQLMSLFELQVKNRPDSQALSFDGKSWSYKQLDKQVNQLANWFAANGVTSNSRLAVATSRTQIRVIAMLAVLKSGACMVPISEELPLERQHYMLHQAEVGFLLTDKQNLPRFADVDCQM